MTDFKAFVEKQEKERRPWLFIEKAKGKGRGYHKPHRGRPGKRGGSLPREIKPESERGVSRAMSKLMREHIEFAVKNVQYYGLETGNEAAMVIAADGSQVNGRKTGTKSTCNIGELITGDEFVGVHNHPSNASFSGEDIALLFTSNMQHLVVIGHDGTLYRMSRTNKTGTLEDLMGPQEYTHRGKPVRITDYDYRRKGFFWLGDMHNEQKQKLKPKFQKLVIGGKLAADEAWKEHSHQIAQRMAKELKLEYERVLP